MATVMKFGKVCKGCNKIFWYSIGEEWKEYCEECESKQGSNGKKRINSDREEDIQ